MRASSFFITGAIGLTMVVAPTACGSKADDSLFGGSTTTGGVSPGGSGGTGSLAAGAGGVTSALGIGGGGGTPMAAGGAGPPGMGGSSAGVGTGGSMTSMVGAGGTAGSMVGAGGSPMAMVGAGGSGVSGMSDGGTSAAGGSTSATGGQGGAGAQGGNTASPGGAGGASSGCVSTTPDQDGDGFTVADGDCNDCDPGVNPGAFEVLAVDGAGNPLPQDQQIDTDCDGHNASPSPPPCDMGLALDGNDAMDGARAIDICQIADAAKRTWGIVSAAYSTTDTQPLDTNGALGHGVLPAFGSHVKPRQGQSLLALSSGTARQPTDPGYQDVLTGFDKMSMATALAGFSTAVGWPACPTITPGTPHDSAMLTLTLRVPTNARSFVFRSKLYTAEVPAFVCSQYNDFAAVLMSPPPPDVDPSRGDILLGMGQRPLAPNSDLVDICTPGTYMGQIYSCPGDIAELDGTGFTSTMGAHGATSWLETSAAVTPGSLVTLSFAIWDSGDGLLDSTVLFDDFRWSTTTVATTTVKNP